MQTGRNDYGSEKEKAIMKLSTGGDGLKSDVVVNVSTEKDQYFKGTVASRKSIKSAFKNDDGSVKMRDIYIFTLIDTNMETMQKAQGSKEYKSVDVSAGDSVTVFAPTRLNNALKQTKDGDTVKFVYLGKGEKTKFGGRAHQYDVELI
jgi:hypothetical protein